MSDQMPTDDPAPVGPLGAAMADLVDDVPAADFTAWSVIGEVRRRRSVRRQVAGGLAAGVAAIGVLVTVGLVAVGGGGSDTATSATSASSGSASSAAASVGTRPSSALASIPPSPSSSLLSSSSPETAAGGSASAPAPSVLTAPGDGSAFELPSSQGESGSGVAPTVVATCAPLPFTPEQLALIADRIPGLTPQTSCATDDVQLAVQDYTVNATPGVTLRAEVRAGTFDPCLGVEGAVCLDDGSGVISTERARGADRDTLVWVSGRAGSTVLTLTVPAGSASPLTVDELAAVVAELAATR